MSLPVAGVDGARGGWVVASLGEGAPVLRFESAIAPLLQSLAASEFAALVVDMPIGLSADGNRPADQLARERLGARRSTFFPTPVRAVLDQDCWEDANETSRLVSGKGLSKQTWNLVPKIREIDGLWSPDFADRLSEGHPELSFSEMAGGPVLSKKSTAVGQAERLELLCTHVDERVPEIVDACPASWRKDAVDALAVAWTAGRLARGDAVILGNDVDERGRPMQLAI